MVISTNVDFNVAQTNKVINDLYEVRDSLISQEKLDAAEFITVQIEALETSVYRPGAFGYTSCQK